MEMLNQKQKVIAIIVIAIVIVVIGYYYISSTKEVYVKGELENIVEETEEETEEVNKKNEKIKVHITGSVEKNGIVEVEKEARIYDVIDAAGGITEDADLTNVNLAYKIEDGQKIYIPSIDDRIYGEETEVISVGAGEGVIYEDYNESSYLVNINKANTTELTTLPGIGESTATKIIEYRKTNGNFKTKEDIKNVPGIGESKYNTIKELITV